MSIVLNEMELSQIAALREQADAGTIGYWQVYQALANMLQSAVGCIWTPPRHASNSE